MVYPSLKNSTKGVPDTPTDTHATGLQYLLHNNLYEDSTNLRGQQKLCVKKPVKFVLRLQAPKFANVFLLFFASKFGSI